jgi:hypothetical protein
MERLSSFFRLIQSPWGNDFGDLIRSAQRSLVVVSPYIGIEPCRRIVSEKSGEQLQENLKLLVVTDLSQDNLLSGSTDIGAVYYLARCFPKTEVVFLPSIHAKVYIADFTLAIITSGNMTNSGLYRNYEYGIRLENKNTVEKIREDILAYAGLGSKVDVNKLKMLMDITTELKEIRAKVERSTKSWVQKEFDKRMKVFNDDIIRTRAAGRAPHTIFADAIIYLLRRRGMSTQELHSLIQGIHPDLCDDNVDRVIDGKHFGKKWKHAVRTAQQHLKKEGIIELKEGVWYLRKE